MKYKDKHVEAVIEKMRSRSEVGYKKYGTNLERTDYTFLDWVTAAQEELLDGSLYLQVLWDRFENDLKNAQNMQESGVESIEGKMATITQISDYVIFRCKAEGDTDLSALKHQKLLYYIQAWHLAFFGIKAFEGDFQAWIHGPVNRDIYDLYIDTKYLYSEMTMNDVKDIGVVEKLPEDLKQHIDTILDAYAKFSATELENMTHNEKPWIEAREGVAPNERCERTINPETMRTYYASRLG